MRPRPSHRDVVQEKFVEQIKRKREKASVEMKELKAALRDAEKHCRELEDQREAIVEDYEGRLQQQVMLPQSSKRFFHWTDVRQWNACAKWTFIGTVSR